MAKPEDASNDANARTGQTGQSGAQQAAGESVKGGGAAAQTGTAAQAGTGAIALLKADHRKVEELFSKFEKATSGKGEIARQICAELIAHTALEEEIFYPACRRAASDEEPLDEAQVEHDSTKVLIADLLDSSDADRFRDAKVSVLAEQIKHHVGEEEAPGRGIFARAQSAGVDTPELATQLQERKQQLMGGSQKLAPSRTVSFQLSRLQIGQNKEDTMASYRSDDRDRDDRGRFMSDDDDRYGRGRSRDDDRRYRARSDRDDDDGRGWRGDPEGHSEASRRGWAERDRSEGRSFRDDDDDRRYGARGGDRDRDERGRFVSEDDRGYSSRSDDRDRDDRGRFVGDDDRGGRSRGYDRDRDERGRYMDDDRGGSRSRGQGGWFGDSRGHAEAARRGWDDRDDRDDRRARSRDDDDRRSSSSRDHGGWYGDSRGHSEAARRGWQDRR
jgi:hypothetical protein